MADQDLSVTGANVQILIMLDGLPVDIIDAVVMSSAEPTFDVIEQKHLGTDNVSVESRPTGWKGDLEISNKNGAVDRMLDAMIASTRNNIPYVFNVREVTRYRDGSSQPYTYLDSKVTSASRSAKRGEASTHRLSWRCGTNRIAG